MPTRSQLTRLARNLRGNQTESELKLWWSIRSRQLNGLKFRRQYPIGCYIVDFICIERRLVVEVDGSQHLAQLEADEDRTMFLQSKQLSVLRFTNVDVLTNLEGVIYSIERHIAIES